MSTLAIHPINRAVRFYEAPIGKKAVMAITGVMLVGYVFAHRLATCKSILPMPSRSTATPAFCTIRLTRRRCGRRAACCCWR